MVGLIPEGLPSWVNVLKISAPFDHDVHIFNFFDNSLSNLVEIIFSDYDVNVVCAVLNRFVRDKKHCHLVDYRSVIVDK